MITIVNYGIGNIRAFHKIYSQLHFNVKIANTPTELDGATKLILPGVGSFDWAMQNLIASGMRPKLDELVLNRKIDVLGVCVGMHIMASSSEEGEASGLGWIDAEVVKIRSEAGCRFIKTPHMGWNDISYDNQQPLFTNLNQAQFYFLHSFYLKTKNDNETIATASYGSDFTVAVRRQNIYGTQFHPEKSHLWGTVLLKNFAENI